MFGGFGTSTGTFNPLAISKDVRKVEKILNKFKVEKDFKIDVKSLKIAINFPEMSDPKKASMMDMLIFL